jgi:hypothetical protein
LRVRIKVTPKEDELDGISVGKFERGTVREVSMSIGSWLIAEGYAEPEMRHEPRLDDMDYSGPRNPRDAAHDHPRRRSTDR